MFHVVGAFAEFEREFIRERVNAGLARARAKGRRLGRPPIHPSVEAKIRELAAPPKKLGKVKIAKMLGIGTGTVQRVLA